MQPTPDKCVIGGWVPPVGWATACSTSSGQHNAWGEEKLG